MSKIKILVVPSDNRGGVGFYRSTQPHIELEKQFPDEFEVTIDMSPNFSDPQSLEKYDIIHIHKGLFPENLMPTFHQTLEYLNSKGVVTIMDIDDHWSLSMYHPMFAGQRYTKSDVAVRDNLHRFSWVTTTTPIFAKEISKFNKNVMVLPNAIDPTDSRFAVNKNPSKLLRVGLVMGSAHEHDVALLNNLPRRKDVQYVLCGYDLRGTIREFDRATGKSVERPIKPEESVWYRYEKQVTGNYAIVSPEYKAFLEKFLWGVQYPNVENENYKRCWTKDMNHYYEHFSEIDVLLAPLKETEFNRVKSQLKVVEAAFSHTAIIASEFGPYTIDLKTAIEKGNILNPDGNALLVSESRNHKDWAKYINRLADDPALLKQLQDNLYRDIHEKYDLRNVTKERAQFYKDIVKKNKEE
jgi:glycosyltransferase involved in cell wall biosynthesis